MSLILIPQISGSVLPANVHQRVVYKKPQLFMIACAFAAFSPSLAWVSGAGTKYASAFSAVPEGRLYLQAQALLATVHVMAGRRRSSAQFASDCHSPVTRDGSVGFCSFRSDQSA
jgi:hypothetical protein